MFRRRGSAWALIITCILLAGPWVARAQSGAGDLWESFTVRDGLPSANVSAILAARDGTLWFGTETGAVNYDGTWVPLSPEAGLPAGRVRAIAQTLDNAIWFGLENGGLARCVSGSPCRIWTSKNGLPSNDVRALAADSQGGIWAGTSQGLAYLPASQAGPIQVEKSLAGIAVWALAMDKTGKLWIGTEQRGLWQRNQDHVSPVRVSAGLLDGNIYSLLLDSQGRLWVGTGHGLAMRYGKRWTQINLQEAIPVDDQAGDLRVFALAQDGDGGLWIGTDQGCFYQPAWPGSSLKYLGKENGLIGDFVRALAIDADGAVWMGTIAGASRYAGRIWQTVQEAGLGGEQINALLTDRSGRTWVGTERNGVAMWDGQTWHLYNLSENPDDQRVLALFEDSRGRVWIGTGAGVGYIVCATHPCTDFDWQSLDPAAGLPEPPVWSIGEDSAGRIWLGTNAGGVWWDEQTGMHSMPELADWRINAIYQGRDGAMWFGTNDNGLWRLAGEKWDEVSATAEPQFKSVALHGLGEDGAGTLWAGTYDAKLMRYAGGEWHQVDGELAGSVVLGLNFIDDSLWVGTYNGFNRFDGRTSQLFTGSILPGAQVRAIAPGTDRSYWVGTSGGLVHYKPGKQAPWVRVESANLEFPRAGVVQLRENMVRDVRLLAGDVGTRPDDLIFLTQLVGVEGSERVSTSRLVSYDDYKLAPGTYTLRVTARDPEFNYAPPGEVTIHTAVVAPMVTLPWGASWPPEVLYPVVGLGLVAVTGVALAAGTTLHARTQSKRSRMALAERQREAVERHFNPYISGEPVREPEMFYGRQDLLAKIINALHQNSIMISGERRIGKTSLLLQLGETLRTTEDPEWVFVPIYVDLEGTPPERFFRLLIEDIVNVLRERLPALPELRMNTQPGAEYTDRDFVADLRTLLVPLRSTCAPRLARLILLLDEMDVINSYDTLLQQQLRRVFMTSLAHNLGAVVAGVAISKDWERLESPWYNMFIETNLAPLDDADARRLLVEPVAQVYSWTPEALDGALAYAEGRPFRLQQCGLHAVNHMLSEGRTQITLSDVQAALAHD
jgi:ligand-binding sensor domain-containing protein